jgi:hypothetical protein
MKQPGGRAYPGTAIVSGFGDAEARAAIDLFSPS